MEGSDFGTVLVLQSLVAAGYLTDQDAQEVCAAIADVSERYVAGLITHAEAETAIQALAQAKAQAWNERQRQETH